MKVLRVANCSGFFGDRLSAAPSCPTPAGSTPNLRAVNFVVHGIFGWGVASNLRFGAQAKGLTELLRSRDGVVPGLAARGKPAERRGLA